MSELVLFVISVLSILAWIYFWRKLGPQRAQLFDPKRVRRRWADTSWRLRLATLLSLPVGVGLGIAAVKAQESGAIPEIAIRLAMLALIIFIAHRVSKRLRDEGDREGE